MVEKLRIADILDNNIIDTGGTERSTHNLLQFRSFGRSLLITPYPVPADLPYESLTHANGNLIHVPLTRQHFPSPQELKRTVRHLSTYNPDIILLNTPTVYTASLYMGLPKELKDRCAAIWRLIIDAPSTEPQDDRIRHVVHKLVQRPGIRAIQIFIANSVPLNLAISNAVSDSLKRNGVHKPIKIIPTQVGREYSPHLRFQPGIELRNRYLQPDEIGIIYVGRITPGKGLEWLLDLYKILRQSMQNFPETVRYKKIKITIAGGAKPQFQKYFAALKFHSAQKEQNTAYLDPLGRVTIDWAGDISPHALEEYYNAYDICLALSDHEPFGRTPVEAMSAGATVIGNGRCQSTREILSEPGYPVGLLANTPEETADHILGLMQDPKKLDELQTNALFWGRSQYTLERAERLLLEALIPISNGKVPQLLQLDQQTESLG